jgi:large subunit ribosomal protein L5
MYREQVMPALQQELGYDNVMEVPRLEKIVVNVGLGEALQNAKALDATVEDIMIITGQRPVVTRARKSIANFKLRMWNFLDRLCNIALPRQRDFRGISPEAFDGRGNYSLGLQEQLAFPEMDYDKIDKIRGMEITIVTTAQTDEEGFHLLRHLGMPFKGR